MITLRRISNSEDKDFLKLIPLYTEAFPAEERREVEQLKELLLHEPEMYFNVVEFERELAGLVVYWDFKSFYYLEHLAVFAEMRNKKIGQQILDWIGKHLNGLRLLEVEPAETEIAVRRINYYQRNGYQILDKTYLQPSYRQEEEGVFPLWIMGNSPVQSEKVLEEQLQMIRNKVYYRQ